ncbi:Protein COFACTOR ASSEMBLY OF COMPLEX C SUBUNIT B CCB2, chloroplastic [Linum perenne]
MSPTISDAEKEEFAWGSYVLLRNTNTIAVLISMEGELCVRGYWNVPFSDAVKDPVLDWFQSQIERIGLEDLKDTLYFQQAMGSELREMLPNGTRSLLVVPILPSSDQSSDETKKNLGFVLLASNLEYAYNEKDRAWIKAIANKFGGERMSSKL